MIQEGLIRPVEAHDLCFTQFDRQLTKVTEKG
jgi:hypothetical protein